MLSLHPVIGMHFFKWKIGLGDWTIPVSYGEVWRVVVWCGAVMCGAGRCGVVRCGMV